MTYLYLQCDRARGGRKDGYKMDVLCIVDQDHWGCPIVKDHSSQFKGIQLMANPQLMTYYTEKRATLITNLRKK